VKCSLAQFLRRQLRKFENVTVVARWRKHFRFFLAIFLLLTSHKRKSCFNTQEFDRVLSAGVVKASNRAPLPVLSNKAIWVFNHWRVNTPHIHTSYSLFFQSYLLSAVTVTPSDSDSVNRSTSIQRFRLIHTTPSRRSRVQFFAFCTMGCMCTWLSSYEIVEDCSDKGGRNYQPLHHFILQEVLACKCVMFMLRVMIYVVSYKLFWNWIRVVRFQVASHEVCSDCGFVIWHFLHWFFKDCVVVITEYLNWNHFQYRWSGEPNNTLKSNGPWTRFFPWKKSAAGKTFCKRILLNKHSKIKRMSCRQNLCKKCAAGKIFDWIMIGGLSCWCSM